MKKEQIYIDLSKCSDDERKHIFSLLPEEDDESQYEIFGIFKYLHYDKIAEYWFVDVFGAISKKTELTYPEFIKLFGGGDGENETSLQIAIKALENIINPIGYMKSQLEEGDTLNGGYAIMLTEKPQFYQNIAEEALRKINSNQ